MSHRFHVVLFVFCLIAEFAASQEETTPDKSMAVAVDDSIPSFFHFFFAVCLSLVSAVFAYVSLAEDRIMRKFGRDGRSIEGRILDWKYVRPLHNKVENDAEYDVTVDYRYLEVGGYSTVIRKQIKCRRSDLYQAEDSQHEFVKVCVELDNVFSFDEAMFDRPNRQRIRLLVLDDHPNSGIPETTVRDSTCPQRRVPTLGLFLLLLLLTAFCISLGLASFLPATLSMFAFLGASLAATLALLSIDGVFLWCCRVYKKVDRALAAEYLEGGEMLVKLDEETLGTLSTCESMSSHRLSNPSLRNSLTSGSSAKVQPSTTSTQTLSEE